MVASLGLQSTTRSPERAIKNLAKRAQPAEPRFYVTDVGGEVLFEYGNVSQPMIVAGITKLYTTAMVLREFDRGALSPDKKASHILPHKMLSGLCVVRGKDYSDDITVAHLLSHRSGITDYFSFPRRGALSLLRQTEDRGSSVDTRTGARNRSPLSRTLPPRLSRQSSLFRHQLPSTRRHPENHHRSFFRSTSRYPNHWTLGSEAHLRVHHRNPREVL